MTYVFMLQLWLWPFWRPSFLTVYSFSKIVTIFLRSVHESIYGWAAAWKMDRTQGPVGFLATKGWRPITATRPFLLGFCKRWHLQTTDAKSLTELLGWFSHAITEVDAVCNATMHMERIPAPAQYLRMTNVKHSTHIRNAPCFSTYIKLFLCSSSVLLNIGNCNGLLHSENPCTFSVWCG